VASAAVPIQMAPIGSDDAQPAPAPRGRALHHHEARVGVVARARHRGQHRGGLAGLDPGGQRARAAAGEGDEDRRDLLGRLELAQHHLGRAGAERAVMVDPCRGADLLEGEAAQAVERLIELELARLHLGEQSTDVLAIHAPVIPNRQRPLGFRSRSSRMFRLTFELIRL
jgi:hypothetical protein